MFACLAPHLEKDPVHGRKRLIQPLNHILHVMAIAHLRIALDIDKEDRGVVESVGDDVILLVAVEESSTDLRWDKSFEQLLLPPDLAEHLAEQGLRFTDEGSDLGSRLCRSCWAARGGDTTVHGSGLRFRLWDTAQNVWHQAWDRDFKKGDGAGLESCRLQEGTHTQGGQGLMFWHMLPTSRGSGGGNGHLVALLVVKESL